MILEKIFVFAFGLIWGSFLNVCIFRMPKSLSVVKPRSHCPKCRQLIAWYDNIPVLSFIFLKAKCRHCKAIIPWRYPLVELITAILFLATITKFGLSLYSVGLMVFISGLIVSTFIDIDCREIPDIISVGGTALGIVLAAFTLMPKTGIGDYPPILVSLIGSMAVIGAIFLILIFVYTIIGNLSKEPQPEEEGPKDPKELIINLVVIVAGFILGWKYFEFAVPLINSASIAGAVLRALLGAAVGTSIIYLTGLFGDIVFRKETMGGGDVKFLAMIGAFLGWKAAVITFFLSAFIGSAIGIIHKIKTKDSYFPFGPSLAIAALLYLFFSEKIMNCLIYCYK